MLLVVVGSRFWRGDDMSADKKEGALKPVTPARVAEELRKLSSQRKAGTLDADEYEHRFARMIGELRDRRIDGSRAEILATLMPLMHAGALSAADWHRLPPPPGLAPATGRPPPPRAPAPPRLSLGGDAPRVSAVGYGGMHLSIQDRPPEEQGIR